MYDFTCNVQIKIKFFCECRRCYSLMSFFIQFQFSQIVLDCSEYKLQTFHLQDTWTIMEYWTARQLPAKHWCKFLKYFWPCSSKLSDSYKLSWQIINLLMNYCLILNNVVQKEFRQMYLNTSFWSFSSELILHSFENMFTRESWFALKVNHKKNV